MITTIKLYLLVLKVKHVTFALLHHPFSSAIFSNFKLLCMEFFLSLDSISEETFSFF